MCPKKCVTPHTGSVADRTNLSRSQQATHLQERLKVEGGSSPIRPGPHRVQRTDLPYFCGEVRNKCPKWERRVRTTPFLSQTEIDSSASGEQTSLLAMLSAELDSVADRYRDSCLQFSRGRVRTTPFLSQTEIDSSASGGKHPRYSYALQNSTPAVNPDTGTLSPVQNFVQYPYSTQRFDCASVLKWLKKIAVPEYFSRNIRHSKICAVLNELKQEVNLPERLQEDPPPSGQALTWTDPSYFCGED
ncbi:hypothetical protein AVEN_102742-1 [Araneus ventricosus]|uniref:Uncharacterized protein n=1 Tax=Araneus ventricosus TaxID=182803 RepID=A0A4Y2HS12_ARAVE|nr:hypothetical protein AVEN_102742-1 [Araneus ventricosus]